MTHEELLYRMNWASERYHDTDGRAQYFNALRAVVELHKPDQRDEGYVHCSICFAGWDYPQPYPCPTIQAIEKELQ